MKKILSLLLLTALFCSACKKSSSSSATTEVLYMVTTSNSSSLYVTYNNVLQQKELVNAQTSWQLQITVDQKPFTAYLQASSTSPFSSVTTSCTVTIYVNGNQVKTATVSSNTTAVAEAEYTIQ